MMTELSETTIALTGNLYLEHPVSTYTSGPFHQVVEFLRGCDATLTNMECALQDGEDWPAYMAGTGWSATYMAGRPSMIDEMRYLGIDGIYAANNHVADFGEAGLLTTIKHLRQREMPYAGIGASLTEATEACYFDTPTGRRVAVLAALDWGPRGRMDVNFPWPWGQMASDDGPPFRPRPGVSLLRYNAETTVDAQTFEELRRASEYLGWEEAKSWRRGGASRDHALTGPYMIGWEEDTENEFYFMGRKFVKGDGAGLKTTAVQEDLDRIYKCVRDARQQADFVVVALHDQSHGQSVHGHIDEFAHGAIDAGADIYLNNAGHHRGIEIYNGKVIIYGQPGLFLQNEQVTHVPSSAMRFMNLPPDATASEFLAARQTGTAAGPRFADAAQRKDGTVAVTGTVVHVVVFDEQGKVREVRIQPLAVSGGPKFRSGVPLWPEGDSNVASMMIERVAVRSAEFGTTVDERDGVGFVKVA